MLNILFELLATTIRKEKQVKGIQTGKKYVKLSVFAHDKVLYRENPYDATKNVLELINEISKVARYKINMQKSVVFLYTKKKSLFILFMGLCVNASLKLKIQKAKIMASSPITSWHIDGETVGMVFSSVQSLSCVQLFATP